ncbi:MAG: SCO family protein, partial [Sphingomonadaceae bacterium]
MWNWSAGVSSGACPGACPMLLHKLKSIEAKLTPAQRRELRVVLVSLAPDSDTPASLAKLMQAHGLDAGRWTMLRPRSDEQVHELAAVLGVKFRRLKSGMINHSTVITVLDRAGVITASIDGLDAESTPVLDA